MPALRLLPPADLPARWPGADGAPRVPSSAVPDGADAEALPRTGRRPPPRRGREPAPDRARELAPVFARDLARRPAWHAACAVAAASAVLAGCAVAPGPRASRDGPPAAPPPDLAATPDAEPRIEPVRPGGPNKPYVVLGQSYTPQTGDPVVRERGLASWYGNKFHGRRTASGELYHMYAMTGAHRTLPIPSYARVRNLSNGREVIVRINDRGPFHSDRIIDLSYTAALKLGVLRGVTEVELERITFDDIRTGAWRRGSAPAMQPGEPAAPAYAARTPDAPPPLPPAAASPGALPTAPASALAGAAPRVALDPTPAAATVAAGEAAAGLRTSPAADPSADPLADSRATAPDPASAAPAATMAETRAAVPDRPDRGRAYTDAAEGWWLQLGAFRRLDGAEALRRKVADGLSGLAPLLTVFNEAQLYRLQAGPYASRSEARVAAAQLREALELSPLIVERR